MTKKGTKIMTDDIIWLKKKNVQDGGDDQSGINNLK